MAGIAEPIARYGHLAAPVDDKVYLYGGYLYVDSEEDEAKECSTLHAFDALSKRWTQIRTDGPVLYYTTCVTAGSDFYVYGGYGESGFQGNLFHLNTATLKWTLLAPAGQGDHCPMRKVGSGIVCYEQKVILYGGIGVPTGPTQEGAEFVKSKKHPDGRGSSNELHTFDLKEENSTWSSPTVSGTRPPLYEGFSFTMIGSGYVVMFGGFRPGHGKSNRVYILDLARMHWSVLAHQEGEPCPAERNGHAATSLGNYNLLVSGGRDTDDNVLGDLWVLDLKSGKWREVSGANLQARFGHTATAISHSVRLADVVLFGGNVEVLVDKKTKYRLIANTTVLTFEYQRHTSADGASTRLWTLRDVSDNTKLANHTASTTLIEQRKKKEACEKVISEESNVKLRVVKFNHAGIPRSGKTTFLRRFKGEIENIMKARQRGEGEQPSTGVAEDGGQVLVRSTSSAGVKSTIWSVLKEKGDEANMLNQLFYQLLYNRPGTTFSSSFHVSHSPVVGASTSLDNFQRRKGLKRKVDNSILPGTDIITCLPVTTSSDENLDDMLSIIEDTLESKDWEDIKYLLEDLTWLVNTDTGGHSEFLDLQAALIQGPAFNFLYCNLENDLDKQFPVYFTDKEGRSTKKVNSTSTTEEVIFQFLASSACFSSADAAHGKLQSPGYSNSKAMIVGTHLDLVSDGDFKAKDKLLQEMIESTDFYDKDIVVFAAEDQLMFAVDNMTGNESEIKGIQQILEKAIVKNFDPISIPASWLVLSLYLRRKNSRAISLKECEEIGRKLKITPDNLQHALWFLHHCVGLLLYYPEVEALRNTVICNPQLVHDSTSNLITNASSFDKVGQKACKEFKEQALFHLCDIQRAMKSCDRKNDLLPPEKLVILLKHINILSMPFPDREIFFMPSLMRNARVSELTIPPSGKSDPTPLILRYDCGYIPVGLFTSVIANLLSQQLKGWEFIKKGLCKNRIQFRVGEDFDLVTLNSYPQYLEIAITRSEDVSIPVNFVCSHVRSVVQSTLLSVISQMNHEFNMGYKFGFRCPIHPDEKHLCLLAHGASDEAANKSARKMLCYGDLQDPKPLLLKPKHKVWFEECTSIQAKMSGYSSASDYSHQLDTNQGNVPAQKAPLSQPRYHPKLPHHSDYQLAEGFLQPSHFPAPTLHTNKMRNMCQHQCESEVVTKKAFLQNAECGACFPTQSAASNSSSTTGECQEHQLLSVETRTAYGPHYFTDPSPPHTEKSLSLSGRPELHQLNCLKVGEQQLKIIRTVGVDWKELGLALHFEYNLIKVIENDAREKALECCRELLHRWLNGEACQPITWARLIEALEDAEHSRLASDLEKICTS